MLATLGSYQSLNKRPLQETQVLLSRVVGPPANMADMRAMGLALLREELSRHAEGRCKAAGLFLASD